MDGCSVQPETQFVETSLSLDGAEVLSVGDSLLPMGAAGKRLKFEITPPLEAPLLTFPCSLFHTGTHPQDSSGLKSEFSLLSEQPKAI